MRPAFAVGAGAFIAVLLGSSWRTSAHDPTTKVTYTLEIARLLDKHCVSCHRPGGRAPMPFTTYAEAWPWAHAMKEMVLDREMPPWPAAPGFGDFENDPTLTPFEAGVLAAWSDGGSPNGNEGDLPAAVAPGSDAADAVQTLPPWPVKSGRASALIPVTSPADRWIARWEFRATEPVLQADIAIVGGGLDERLGVWVPPGSVNAMPVDSAQRLPATATIRVTADIGDAHAAAADGGTLRLWFAPARPEQEVHHRTIGCGLTPIDRDASAFAIWPHVDSGHVAVTLRTAAGAIRPLVVISRFNLHYQPTYRFRRPVALPKGSVLDVRGPASGCEVDLALVTAARQP